MRRGKDRLIGAALCLLLLFGAGCSPAPGADQETLDRELDVQLGLLAEVITHEERSAAMDLWMRLRPVRQARLDRGEYRRGDREQELLEELNGLYEAYTIRYLGGDDLGWGYTDPEEALEDMVNGRIHWNAVIVDYMMPGIKGTALAQRMKKLQPYLCVIMITGLVDREALELRQDGQIDNILIKPVNFEELVAAIDKGYRRQLDMIEY